MYLHNILRRDESEIISQVFKAQLADTVKGDWTESVQQDLEDFDIKLDFKSMGAMKKEKHRSTLQSCQTASDTPETTCLPLIMNILTCSNFKSSEIL